MALGPFHLRGFRFLRCCLSLACNLRVRRGVERRFHRAHKHKVRPHSRATAHHRSPPRNLQLRKGSGMQAPQSPQVQGGTQRARRTHRSKSSRRRDTLAQHPCLTKDRPTVGHGARKKTSEAPSCRPLCASSPRHPRRDHVYLGRRGRRATLARRRAHRWKSPCEPLPRS